MGRHDNTGFHFEQHLRRLVEQNELLLQQTHLLIQENKKIMKTLQDLQADVTAQGTAIDSASTLLKGLADQIRNLPADAQAISDLADKVEAQTATLSQAVVDNTPAA